MPIEAGLLDREIIIQVAPVMQSLSGEVSYNWDEAEQVTTRAQWLPGGTREGLQAQRQIGSYIDGVYRIYFIDEPKPDVTRIIGHDGRIYDVKPAIEIGRHEGWMVPVVARGE